MNILRPQSHHTGFTLIELLVVIAIIGILSSVVLASLNDARQSARDSAIKQQVASYVTMLETERARTGRFQNHLIGWVGNDIGYTTCTTAGFTGPLADEFRALCQSIIDQTSSNSATLLHIGTHPNFNTRSQYAVMVYLNNESWYCRGSGGGNYEGEAHPVSGPIYGSYPYWGGTGCYANP